MRYTYNVSESTVRDIPKPYAQTSMESTIFAGFVKPDTISQILKGKYKIVEQLTGIDGLDPCIVLADSISY